MGAGYHGGFGSTSGSVIGNAGSDGENEIDENLKKELRNNNIKFNEKDMVFITRDKTGQIIWLENGNSSAGLKHILDGKDGSPGHAKDFEKVFEKAFKAKAPAIIDVEVDIDEMILPMVPGGKPIYDMIMSLSEEVMS